MGIQAGEQTLWYQTIRDLCNMAELECPSEFLAHISPLGWAHILLTGEYFWPQTKGQNP
jgi:hypothetical protein